jgi:hypothetical protein
VYLQAHDLQAHDRQAHDRRYRPARRLPPEAGLAVPLPAFPVPDAAFRRLRPRQLASAAKQRNSRQKSSGKCHHKADRA